MNRPSVILAAATLAAILSTGCETTDKPADKAAVAALVAPDKANYFELKQDGKTYLLGSNGSREAFLAGKPPKFEETKFDNGKTVMVEKSAYTEYNRLVAEYKKAKGL